MGHLILLPDPNTMEKLLQTSNFDNETKIRKSKKKIRTKSKIGDLHPLSTFKNQNVTFLTFM